MNYYDFIQLTQEHREAIVSKQGTFLAIRYSCGASVCLYSMDKYYVEVVHLPEYNKVLLVRAFRSKFCLDPYLEMVDLSDILI